MVKDWPVHRRQHDERWFKFFEKDGVALVCGGIGAEAARRAAEAILTLYHPALIISAGFAGGLDASLRAGDTLIPQHVIDADDGSRTEHAFGHGVLVSFQNVADIKQKAKLGKAFGAQAVDMEAAAVARCAEAHGVKFLACKVISDASDSRMLPIMRFVGSDGRFYPLRLLAHVVLRPWLWGRLFRLAQDSAMAAAKLCEALAEPKVLQHADSEKQLLTQ